MRWDRLDPPELTKSLPWGNGADASKSWFVRLMTHVGGIKPRTSSLNEVSWVSCVECLSLVFMCMSICMCVCMWLCRACIPLVVQDLGCIEYVFSDKTGTLTVNKMRFANAYVRGGLRFNEAENPGSIAAALGATDDATLAENMEHFLQVLSLCHTAVPERLADSGELVYVMCVCVCACVCVCVRTVVLWFTYLGCFSCSGTTRKAQTNWRWSRPQATTAGSCWNAPCRTW